jgi:hypothetical protein
MKTTSLLNFLIISVLILNACSLTLRTRQFVPGRRYNIVNSLSGLCAKMEVNNGVIARQACDNNPLTFWYLEKQNDDGFYFIRNSINYDQVFDIYAGGLQDSANLMYWDLTGGDEQRWFIEPVADKFLIRAKHSGKCLQQTDDALKQYACDSSNASQLFYLKPEIISSNPPQNGKFYSVINKESGFCARLSKYNEVYDHKPCDNDVVNYWRFDQNGAWWVMRTLVIDQIWDLYGGQGQDGNKFINNPAHFGTNQRFYIDWVDNTWFQLRVDTTHKCMTTQGDIYVQQPCSSNNVKQLYRIQERPTQQEIDYQPYAIVNKISGNCIKFTAEQSNTAHATCDAYNNAFLWTFSKDPAGWSKITSQGTSRVQVFDIYNGLNTAGNNLGNSDYLGGANQRFIISFVDTNWFTIRAVNSLMCITPSGSNVVQQPCNSQDGNQLWGLKVKPPPKDITGKLISAITGQPIKFGLQGATIVFKNKQSSVTTTGTVNSDASYTTSLIPGDYTAAINVGNYVPINSDFTVDEIIKTKDFVLSPIDNTVRFVLTWGDLPKDMDIYMTNLKTKATIYYKARQAELMKLDVDDIDGRGPETITLYPGATGKYQVYARRFTTDASIKVSASKLEVYREGGQVYNLNMPTTGANGVEIGPDWQFWDILIFDAATGQFTITNTVKDKLYLVWG